MEYCRTFELLEAYTTSYNKDPESENTYEYYYALYTYLCSELYPEQAQSIMDSIFYTRDNKIDFDKNILTFNYRIGECLLYKYREPE